MTQTREQPSEKTFSTSCMIISGLLVAFTFFFADQVSKYLIRTLVQDNGGFIEVLPFFNLVNVWNDGVSFGMMQMETGTGVMFLIAIAAVITALFAVIMVRSERMFTAISCGIIIGGSCGNIIDRIYFSAVYDFLDFHAYGYHWPAFNVADCCVVIGIAMIAYDSLFLSPKPEPKTTP